MPARFETDRLLRPSAWTAVPFVLCFALGVASLAVPPYVTRRWQWLVALGLIGVGVALALLAVRRGRRTWADPVAPWLSFVLIAVLRDGSGGTTSGLASLVVLPILWLAILGTRRDLAVGAVLTAATFLVPVLLVGAPTYPAGDWRRALLWTAVAVLVAPVVQRVVRQWQHELDRQRTLAVEVALSEQRWRILMDHLPDATVLVVDEDLRIDRVTGAGAMRHGLGDAAGRRLDDVSRPENAVVLEGLVRAALHGEEGIAELSATATGAAHEVLVTPLPSADRPQALVLARDVSRERTRELALVRARDRARRMFEEAPQGMALLAMDGRVAEVNPALCAMFERAASEIVGRGLSSFGENPLDRAVARHLHDLRTGVAGRAEADWVARTPDGRRVFVALSSIVLAGEPDVEDDDLILVTVTDVSERHGYEERLAHLADHDPLTGLANRRRFDAELTRHLDYCRRYGPIGAVIVLDLDHFKEVNDTLGHAAGDELIVALSAVLRRGVRATDVVSRLGGDEFAVLLPQADRQGAEIVAQGVVERVRNHVRSLDGALRKVTASVGVVVIDQVNEDPGELMAAADMTMYDAKENGRDGYVVLDYANYRQPSTGARMEWQSRIERAIEEDGFELYLQPIRDLATDMVTGAEVLLRMVVDDELVPPGRFLPIAERSGLIVDLDCWVVDRSIALLRDLRRLDPDFRLEVNVSGRSIGQPALEEAVLKALARHDVDADGLVLEITETSAVADVETARRFAERMARAGCEFALDDFGAGFGSFYYLKHLNFDYVKIDGEFVANCHADPTDRLILNSIVGIARGLGKRTVAEFVGEAAVLDVVRAEGVDLAQGYFVGEPIPARAFLEQLAGSDVRRAAR